MPDILSKSEVVAWLRADSSEEDLAYSLFRSAMAHAEGVTGQPLFERAFTVELNNYEGSVLPGINPRDISVAYTATNGEAETWGPFENPSVDDAFRVLRTGRVVFSQMLTQPLYGSYSTLTYTAGYSASDLPENIKFALLMLTADFYDNRSNGVSERITTADRLLQPYKIYTV